MKINFSDSLDKVVTDALALPEGGEGGTVSDEAVLELVHRLYDAVHGRSVATSIGRIAVAPPTVTFPKNVSLTLESRRDLLVLVACSDHLNGNGCRNGGASAPSKAPLRNGTR